MKKILVILLAFLGLMSIASCKSCNEKDTLETPKNLTISQTGLITWDKVNNATGYVVYINENPYSVSTNQYQVNDLTKDFTYRVYAVGKNYLDSAYTETQTYKAVVKPPIQNEDITIGISGPSEVKVGQSIKLVATVDGTTNKEVIWSIKNNLNYATIQSDGTLVAEELTGDQIIEVVATSQADLGIFATKVITIVARPVLTQEMLNKLNENRISFEGYLNISLYTLGLFEKLDSTNVINVKTSMDGTNWYAQYENGNTGTIMDLYYKNHNGVTPYPASNLGFNVYFVPLKFDLTFAYKDDCIRDLAENKDNYDGYSISDPKKETTYMHRSPEYKWSTEKELDGWEYTGIYEDR